MRGALSLAAVIAGCSGGSSAPPPPPAPRPAPAPAPVVADTGPAGYIGVLVPSGQAEVLAPFTSAVAELFVELGADVAAGEPLARLDDRPLRDELAIVTAELKSARALVATASVERRAAAAKLEMARTGVSTGVSSGAEVEVAEFELTRAGTMVGQAAAAANQHKARIALLQQRMVDTTLTTPLGGKVALIYAKPGGRVTEGSPVVRVISSNEVYVKFAIPGDRAGTMKAGDKIDVAVDGRDARLPGVVKTVAPELDPIAQMILAEATLEPTTQPLQSGLDCRIFPRRQAGDAALGSETE